MLKEIGGVDYAFGLQWSRLSGGKISTEVATIVSETGLSLGVVRQFDNADGTQNQLGLSEDKSSRGTISAAGALADIVNDALFVDRLTDSIFWICAIYEGEVLPDGDRIVTLDNLLNEISSITSTILEADSEASSLPMYFSDDLADIIPFDRDASETLDSLFEEHYSSPKTELSHLVIKNQKQMTLTLILVAFIISMGAYAAYQPVVDLLSEKETIEVQETIKIIDSGPTQFEILEGAKAQELKWLADEFGQDSSSIIEKFSAYAQSIPATLGGWKSSAVMASPSSEVELQINSRWTPSNKTSALVLSEIAKSQGDLFSSGVNGKEAYLTHIDTVNLLPPVSPAEVVKFIDEQEYRYRELTHDLQMLDYEWSISEVDVSQRKEPIAGIENQQLANKTQVSYKKYRVEIKGNSSWKLLLLPEILNKSKTFIIKNIATELGGEAKWIVEGEIYEI